MGDWTPRPEEWTPAQAEKARSIVSSGRFKGDPSKLETLRQAVDYYDKNMMAEPAGDTVPPFGGDEPDGVVAQPDQPAPEAPAPTTPAPRARMSADEAEEVGYRNPWELGDESAGFGASLAALVNGETPRTTGRGVDAPPDTRSEYDVGRDSERALQDFADADQPGAYRAAQTTQEMIALAPTMFVAPYAAAPAMVAPTAARTLATGGMASMPTGLMRGMGASESENVGEVIDDGANQSMREGLTGAALSLIPGAATGAYRAVKKAPQSIASGARAVGDWWTDAGARMHGKTMPTDLAQQARTMVAPSAEGRAMRADMLAGETGARTAEVAGELSNLQRAVDPVRDYANISMKPDVVQKSLAADWAELTAAHGSPKAVNQAQQEAAFNAMKSARVAMDFLKTYHNGAGASRKLGRVLEEVKPLMAQGARGSGPEASRSLFIGVDKLKRGVGELLQSDDQTVRAIGRETYAPMRGALEDAGVWGTTSATMQKETNAAYTAAITAEKARFPEKFLAPSATERTAGGDRSLMIGDTGKLGPFLKGLGTEEAATASDVFSTGVRTQAELAQKLAQHYDPPAHIAESAAQAQKFAGNLAGTMQRATSEASAARAMGDLERNAAQQTGLPALARKVLPHPATSARLRALGERELARNPESAALQALAARDTPKLPAWAEGDAAKNALSWSPEGATPPGVAPSMATSSALQALAGDSNVRQMPSPMMRPAAAQAQDDAGPGQTSGHQLEQNVRNALEGGDPMAVQVLGKYAQKIQEAAASKDKNALAVELGRLMETDENFRTRVIPSFQGAR